MVEKAGTPEQTLDLQPGNVHQIGQIPNPLALAHFLATTPLFANRAIFVVVENEIDRHIVAHALPIFTEQTGRKPGKILEWTGSITALPQVQRGVDLLVADEITLENHPLPAKSSFKRSLLELEIGTELSLTELKKFLTNNGYEREPTANVTGRWAARGDIIDIHIGLEHPVRIILDNDRLETLTTFDLGTGKMIEKLQSVTVPPLHLHGRSTLFDHIPNDTIIINFQRLQESIPHCQVMIDSLTVPNGVNGGYAEPKAYHLRTADIFEDIRQAKNTLILTNNQKQAAELIAELISEKNKQSADEKKPTIIKLPTQSRGFVHDASQTLVLTDLAIGFDEAKRAKRTSKVKQALIQALKPGDYVVHLYHGIAKFQGTQMMHVNELDREYFVLEFAERDKIYVPVELAERIDKYVGDPNPKLHRLQDASWHEAVRKVKGQALDLARELLDTYARRSVSNAPQLAEQAEEIELDKRCSFELTPDQKDALKDILADLTQAKPMDRLLCGDVGFGKTEVALRAAYRAVLNGYQVAVLAPTTVLVQQHYDTFLQRLDELGVNVQVLSRLRTTKQQRAAIDAMKNGSADVVIGTHRLLSKDISFKRLGLIIIDEEQRFGVKAKEGLTKLRTSAHVLSMTATPIPRTLHLSLAGVREISTILTAPQARRAVKTVIQPLDADLIRDAISTEMKRKGQTYYLFNRVQQIQQRKSELEALVPKARIGIAHGQMSPAALAKVMHQFDIGEIDVLLATTIVENGLDIPNANTLIVENASRFGLGELYQLKGRVGRSDRQGYAYFLYKELVPEADVKRRFVALQEADQLGAGFELAMKDMEIRGVGNILGKEQHGHAVKIGLHLYLRLLNQAVQELQGSEVEPERDIPIDLPLEARIPEQLLPKQEDRIILYQKLANVRDLKELNSKRTQYSKQERFQKHGQIHPALGGLFDLLEIKLLAARSTLVSIDTTYPSDHNRLHAPQITITCDQPLPKLPLEWVLVETKDEPAHKARATVLELGSNWIPKLKHLIQTLKPLPAEPVNTDIE